MGICLAYRGSLDAPARAPELIAAATRFAEARKWGCQTVDEQISGLLFDLKALNGSKPPGLVETRLTGVKLQPPKTQAVAITFDGEGRRRAFTRLNDPRLAPRMPGEAKYFEADGGYSKPVKTTGAPDSHRAIVELFDMMKRDFMSDLAVWDDTLYWASRDQSKLRETHVQMATAIALMLRETSMMRPMLDSGTAIQVTPYLVVLPDDIDFGLGRKGAFDPDSSGEASIPSIVFYSGRPETLAADIASYEASGAGRGSAKSAKAKHATGGQAN